MSEHAINQLHKRLDTIEHQLNQHKIRQKLLDKKLEELRTATIPPELIERLQKAEKLAMDAITSAKEMWEDYKGGVCAAVDSGDDLVVPISLNPRSKKSPPASGRGAGRTATARGTSKK